MDRPCYSGRMSRSDIAIGAGDEIVLDARGHRCPIPALRLRRALAAAPPGTSIRLIADDPMARIDVPHFAAEAGVDILDVEDRGPATSFLIRQR